MNCSEVGWHPLSVIRQSLLSASKIPVGNRVFVERLWWSVKYECTYLRQFETVSELKQALTGYFDFYNNRRYCLSLNYKTPKEMHVGRNVNNISVQISCGNVENLSGLHTVPQLLRR